MAENFGKLYTEEFKRSPYDIIRIEKKEKKYFTVHFVAWLFWKMQGFHDQELKTICELGKLRLLYKVKKEKKHGQRNGISKAGRSIR